MDDIYQVIDEKNKNTHAPVAAFDKEQWGKKKQDERAAAFKLIDETAGRVMTSDAQASDRLLDVMARFPNHSVSNMLLILAQSPDATRIGDADYWMRKGAYVKRGEKGFTILVPGNEYTREDGSIGTFFDAKKVFDAGQTTAKNRASRSYDTHDSLKALINASPVLIMATEDLKGELSSYDHEKKTIHVQKGLGEPDLFHAMATGIAHAQLAEGKTSYDREDYPGAAEIAATILTKRFGVRPTLNEGTAFPILADDKPQTFKDFLGIVRNVSRDIGNRMQEMLDKPRQRTQTMER